MKTAETAINVAVKATQDPLPMSDITRSIDNLRHPLTLPLGATVNESITPVRPAGSKNHGRN